MNCELCGRDTELYETIIEGTKLDVCKNCSSFGSVICRKEYVNDNENQSSFIKEMPIIEENDMIVDDYAHIIKKARERMKITQEELARALAEKESAITKIESGQMMPQIKTAKKLEQFLKIDLIAKYAENEKVAVKINFGDNTMTIGDILKIKEKKK